MKNTSLLLHGHTPHDTGLLQRLGRCSLPALAAASLLLAGAAHAKNNDWERVSLGPGGDDPSEFTTTLPDGSTRTLRPSCSGGPLPIEGVVTQASTEYAFFVQKGNPNKVLISLDGGGACWDEASCLLSPLRPDLFGGRSTYSPIVDETSASLAQAGGILDTGNAKNPYKNYTKVFVPYCTGDIHWGSQDTTYNSALAGLELGDWKIYHRGTDNLLAVLDQLADNGIDVGGAKNITVAGASAGGYGANLAFAYVAEMASHKARLHLIADSSVGVIDNPAALPGTPPLPFYNTAIYSATGDANWGVEQNLPSWVFGEPADVQQFLQEGSDNPLGFLPSLFQALSEYKPKANLASITPNTDSVQIGFYALMKSAAPDGENPVPQWYSAMAAITAATASLPNYRFFIDNGSCHTYIFTENFYSQGVADWISAMVKPGKAWDSVDAGFPNPAAFPDCPALPQ